MKRERYIVVIDGEEMSFSKAAKKLGMTHRSLKLRIDKAENPDLKDRRLKMITAYGVTMCVAEWSDLTGISPSCIATRSRSGWSDEWSVSVKGGHRGNKNPNTGIQDKDKLDVRKLLEESGILNAVDNNE